MKSNQKGFSLVLIIIIVVLVLVALLLLMKKGIIPQQTANVIQSTSGLDSASKALDNTDLNQVDSGITQLNSDTSF